MPSFAFIKNEIVKHIEHVYPEKWIALFRSGVILKNTTRYNVMPGDLFLDGKFYKKDIESGDLTLLEEGDYIHPNSIRFAGIIDGEIVGQMGRSLTLFQNQEEIDDFADTIISSEIIEIPSEQSYSVQSGWIWDGENFSPPLT